MRITEDALHWRQVFCRNISIFLSCRKRACFWVFSQSLGDLSNGNILGVIEHLSQYDHVFKRYGEKVCQVILEWEEMQSITIWKSVQSHRCMSQVGWSQEQRKFVLRYVAVSKEDRKEDYLVNKIEESFFAKVDFNKESRKEWQRWFRIFFPNLFYHLITGENKGAIMEKTWLYFLYL